MDGWKVGKLLGQHRHWALFLGFNLIAFSLWMTGSALLAQSDILHGKSAVKATFMDTTTQIEVVHLAQNRTSDLSRLQKSLLSDHEVGTNDSRFRRDHKALILLLLIEAAKQGRGRP